MLETQTMAAMETDVLSAAAIAWDHVAPGVLSFDFTPRAAPAVLRPQLPLLSELKASSLREAITRWLEEQL